MGTHSKKIHLRGILILAVLATMALFSFAWAESSLEVVEVEGQVEWTTAPPDLAPLEVENKITVRALRGFGLLPESYGRLALELRKHKVDLLASGPQEIRELAAQAESGALDTDPQPLRDLLTFLENKNYYSWTSLTPGATISPGINDLIRGQGQVVVKDAEGQTHTLQSGLTVQTLQLASASTALASDASVSEIQSGMEPSSDQPKTADPDTLAKTAQFEPVTKIDLSKTWAQAPGSYCFGPDVPFQEIDSDPHWSRLAAICPTADNGHVIAGSVNTAIGLQTWIICYNSQGVPQWSRQLGGSFNLFVTSIVPLGQDGFLVSGNMEADHPGFFIALDQNGQVLWSRASTLAKGTEKGQNQDHPLALATGDQSVVAVGHVSGTDDPVALIMAVPADGTDGWRTMLPDGARAEHVVAVDDGWIVGGQAATTKTAWAARVDTKGQLVWSKQYDQPGAIAALVTTADGQILAGGYDPQTNKVWLMSVLEDGALGQATDLDLTVDNTRIPRTLLGMALGQDNELWLAGETVSDDGWLAKTDQTGQVHWVQIYGQDDRDALTAVLPTAHGATAVGHSFIPESMHPCALWVLNVDSQGQPLAAPTLSTEAQALLDTLPSLSSLHMVQDKDQTIRLILPFTSIREGLPGFGWTQAELGQISCTARPMNTTPGQWDITVHLPKHFFIWDYYGNEAGSVNMDQPVASFVFDTKLNTVLALDGSMANLKYTPASPTILTGLYKDLGLDPKPENTDTISLAQANVRLKLDQDTQGLWGGPLTANVADWRKIRPDGTAAIQLGKLTVQGDYKNLDLTTAQGLMARLKALVGGEEAADNAVSNLVQTFVKSIGTGQGEAVLTDFAFYDDTSEDHVFIKNLTASGEISTPGQDALLHDLFSQYALQGLKAKVEGTDIDLEQASAKLRLDRLSWETIINAAVTSLRGENQEEKTDWQQWVSKILGGVEISFDLNGLHASSPEETPIVVGTSSLRLALTDLDTAAISADLAYAHAGLSGLPEIPAEILPDMARVDIGLAKLPLLELISNFPTLIMDPFSALALLAKAKTTLQINAVDFNATMGGLHVAGQGLVDPMDQEGSQPKAQLNAEAKIRNFQKLTNWLAGTMDNSEAAGMLAVAAMIQLAGVEEKGTDGDIFHRYKVEFDSQGKLLVNGKDLSALLGASGSNSNSNQTEGDPELPETDE